MDLGTKINRIRLYAKLVFSQKYYGKHFKELNKKISKFPKNERKIIWTSVDFLNQNFKTYKERNEFLSKMYDKIEENWREETKCNNWKEDLDEDQEKFVNYLENAIPEIKKFNNDRFFEVIINLYILYPN
jgi:predicted ArsR family transcriptional regulator